MSFRRKKLPNVNSPFLVRSMRKEYPRRRKSSSEIFEYIPSDSIEILHEAARRNIEEKNSKPDTGSRYSTSCNKTINSNQSIKHTTKTTRLNLRYTGGGDHPTINQDWDRVAGWHRMMSFNLEFWWTHSTTLERLAVAMAALCLAVSIANLGYGIWLICEGIVDLVHQENPYICKTQECSKASIWLTSKMDKTKKPCDNFYEYMCGKTSNDTFIENDFHDYTWSAGFPFIPGEDSVLAKILNNPQNDLARDQTTRFYQTCLDSRNRGQHGMGAFFDKVEYIYGTRDFRTFETSSLSLEEVGSRMIRTAGHASFLTFGFHVYPYIEIQTDTMYTFPLQMRFDKGLSDNKSWDNPNFVRILAENILANLKVPANSPITKQVITGVNVMSTLYSDFRNKLEAVNGTPKTLDAVLLHPEFNSIMKSEFIDKGACPPLSIRLNVQDLLQRFLGEDYRVTFADLLAVKVYAAFKVCFEQPSSKFSAIAIPVTHPRSAFVGLWLLHYFFESLPAMACRNVEKEWGFTPEKFKNNLLMSIPKSVNSITEFNCRLNLFQFFGYMPSIEYLESLHLENPAEYLKFIANHIEETYSETVDEFNRIPDNEIYPPDKHLAKIQFQRGVHVEVGLPLVSGVYDRSAIMDHLNISNDHLRNSLNVKAFVIEKARMNWIASTNTVPTIRWFGSGGRRSLVRQLFGLEEPLPLPARLVEQADAVRGRGVWETFLGRKYPNYILYPLVLIGQPHYNVSVAMWHATFKAKLILSILALNLYQTSAYPPEMVPLMFLPSDVNNNTDRNCKILVHGNSFENEYLNEKEKFYFQYTFLNISLFEFGPMHNYNYNVITALRHGLKLLRNARKLANRADVTWNMDPQVRQARMERFMSNQLSTFSEDQLFFMTYVRNYCIGSFKKSAKEGKQERWMLESVILNVLMQTKEFSEVWDCKPDDFMSNNGYPRCLRK